MAKKSKPEYTILSYRQIQILEFVKKYGPTTLKQVYGRTGMNKKTASYHIKKLVEFGYLKKLRSNDHRMKPIILSSMGKKILNRTISEQKLELEELDSIVSRRIPWYGSICGMGRSKNVCIIIPSDKTKLQLSISNADVIDKNVVEDGKIAGFTNHVGKIVYILRAKKIKIL